MNFKNARAYQWSLGIQRQLAGGMIADATYFASASNHMQGTQNINQPPPGPGTPVQVNARRPYPAWGSISMYTWDRNGSFQSLQTKLQKQYGNGLSFLMTYMLSHSIDDLGTPTYQFNLKSVRGNSTVDVRHRFSASPVYELPFGPGRRYATNGIPSKVFGGWQLSALVQLQTGNYLTPGLSGNYSNTASTNDRPDLIGNPNANTPHTKNQWFNTSAFAPRPASGQPGATYSFGNAGKGIISTPGLKTTDLSVVRSFSVHENTKVKFRGDLFNLFNHTNFNFPATTADTPNTFGSITQAQDPRIIQLALKILF